MKSNRKAYCRLVRHDLLADSYLGLRGESGRTVLGYQMDPGSANSKSKGVSDA